MRYSHLSPAQHLDVVEAIVATKKDSNNDSEAQKVVNEMVNGASEGVNSTLGQKKKARKNKSLRAI